MKKMTIAMIAPVLALKPKAVAKSVKAAKAVKPVKAKKPAAGEKNTDALEAPHKVAPHRYQYK